MNVLKNTNTAKFFKILRKEITNVSQILKFVTKKYAFLKLLKIEIWV